jgi:hypothetical protein
MKKLFFLFLFPLASIYSQIEVVDKSAENNLEENLIGMVSQYSPGQYIGAAYLAKLKVIDGKQYYYLSWQNQKYTTIEDRISVTFFATEQELDGLFDAFKSVFKKGSKSELKVGDSSFYLELFSKQALYISTKDGYFLVNPAGLHKLFGKTWNKKSWKAYLKS